MWIKPPPQNRFKLNKLILSRLITVIVVLVTVTAPAHAQDAELLLEDTVKSVSLNSNLNLKSGQRLTLHGITHPESPAWKQKAQLWLAAKSLGQTVRVIGSKPTHNRHGTLMGAVYVGDQWLQGGMLTQGLAFVVPDPSQLQFMDAMLALEHEARLKRLGIWGTKDTPIITPTTAHRAVGQYRILSARVISATRVRARVYLNFGPNYRTDMTVRLDGRLRSKLDRSGDPPETWSGRWVTARGVVIQENGPMIVPQSPYEVRLSPPKGYKF